MTGFPSHVARNAGQPPPIVVVFADDTFPDAAEMLRRHAADGVEVGVAPRGCPPRRADVVIPLMSRIGESYMDAVDGLKMIHQWGAGLDGVDIAAATRRGIGVGNVPSETSGNADSVAEWCMMTALALGRRLPELAGHVRSGGAWGAPIGQAMTGRTAVVVGLGGVGRALVTRLRAFGVRVRAITRTPAKADRAALGLDALGGLDRLGENLAVSDYVFLCLPLTADTLGVIGAQELRLMPAHGLLINAGRGGLVDQEALVAALTSGKIAGGALDVFSAEPVPPDAPILAAPHLIATPHIAGVTDVSYAATARYLADLWDRFRGGDILTNCVNRDAIAAMRDLDGYTRTERGR